jgi:hypothetical protein
VAAGAAAGSVPLSDSDLAVLHRVLLQETDTLTILEQPSVVVATDSGEGGEVAAANARYAAKLADCDAADKRSSSCSQTLVPLMKHKEVQSGSSASAAAACQVSAHDLFDAYVQQDGPQGGDAEEQLASVLPSGAVVAAGACVPFGACALACSVCNHAPAASHAWCRRQHVSKLSAAFTCRCREQPALVCVPDGVVRTLRHVAAAAAQHAVLCAQRVLGGRLGRPPHNKPGQPACERAAQQPG